MSVAERTGLEPATPGVTGRYSNQLNYRSTINTKNSLSISKLKPGDVLLSHGETPHYHRRCFVSLLSSAWSQVGPKRYGRQANSLIRKAVFHSHTHSMHSIEPTKPLRCCMVKPHGLLVQVSSTPHNAYTPCLSTF